MKIDRETRTAKSLHKEYLMHMKNATREDAPKVEQDYYRRMADRVSSWIDWSKLETKKRDPTEERYYS